MIPAGTLLYRTTTLSGDVNLNGNQMDTVFITTGRGVANTEHLVPAKQNGEIWGDRDVQGMYVPVEALRNTDLLINRSGNPL